MFLAVNKQRWRHCSLIKRLTTKLILLTAGWRPTSYKGPSIKYVRCLGVPSTPVPGFSDDKKFLHLAFARRLASAIGVSLSAKCRNFLSSSKPGNRRRWDTSGEIHAAVFFDFYKSLYGFFSSFCHFTYFYKSLYGKIFIILAIVQSDCRILRSCVSSEPLDELFLFSVRSYI